MKQFATFLLLLVIMIPLAETAHAKDEIITYEQLLAIDEPCTVYVMSTDQPKKHCDTRQSRQSVL